MKKLRVLFLMFIVITATSIFGACSCGGDNTVEVLAIKLDQEKLTVIAGEDFSIRYVVSPSTSTNPAVSITMSDNSNRVIFKDANDFLQTEGVTNVIEFSAVSTGTVAITFTTEDQQKSKSCQVTVIPTPEKLEVPSKIAYNYNSGKITWGQVSGNMGYVLTLNDTEYKLPKNVNYYTGAELQQSPIKKGVDYEVSVRATGEYLVSTDSLESSTYKFNLLQDVENLTFNNGVITWDKVANATHYIVQYADGKTSTINTNTFNLIDNVSQKDLDQFKVTVYATNSEYKDGVADGNNSIYQIFDSIKTEMHTVTKLYAPEHLKLTQGDYIEGEYTESKISWDSVDQATNYVINLTNIDTQTGYLYETTEKFFYLPSELVAGNYSINISVQGGTSTTIFKDDFSTTADMTFIKLPTITSSLDQNDLTLNVSDLYAKNSKLNSENIKGIIYELNFLNVETNEWTKVSTTDKNVNIVDNVDIAKVLVGGGDYKLVIRPIAPATQSPLNFANSSVDKQSTNDYTLLYKLFGTTPTKISRSGVATFEKDQLDTKDYIASYQIYVDDQLKTTIPSTHSNIVISDSVVTIDLNFTDFKISQLEQGKYNLRIVPIAKDDANVQIVDSSFENCQPFAFTMLDSVDESSITLIDNKVSWDYTLNSKYLVVVNNGSVNVDTQEVQEEKYTFTRTFDTNVFTIRAIGNDENTLSSAAVSVTFDKLLPVQNVRLENGYLKWDTTENEEYFVNVYNGAEIVESFSTANQGYYLFTTVGDYSVSLSRKIDGKLNSDYTDVFNFSLIKSVDINSVEIAKNGDTYSATFTSVANASRYEIYITDPDANKTTYLVDTTNLSFELPFINSGVYSIQILAVGSDIANADLLANSSATYYLTNVVSQIKTIEKLAAPTVSIENGLIKVECASTLAPEKYNIEVLGTNTQINGGSSQTYDLEAIPAGQYTIYVSALNAQGLDSQKTEFTFTKLGNVAIEVVDGVITFDNISGITTYQVYTNVDGENTKIDNATITVGDSSTTIVLSSLVENTPTQITVMAMGESNFINSSYSDAFTVVKLAKVGNFTKVGASINWDSVTNASGYNISQDTNLLQSLESDTTTYVFPGLSQVGSTNFTIYATGNSTSNGVGYVTGDESSLDVIKLDSVKTLALSQNALTWDAYMATTEIAEEVVEKIILTISGQSGTFNQSFELAADCVKYDVTDLSLPIDKYTITILYKGNGNNTLDSDVVTFDNAGDQLISKFDTTRLEVENGFAQFDLVTDCTTYELYKHNGSEWELFTDCSINQDTDNGIATVEFTNLSEVNINLAILCKTTDGQNYFYSELGQGLTISQLATPTNLKIIIDQNNKSTLTWDHVANSQGYIVTNETTSTTYTVDANTNYIVLVAGSGEIFDTDQELNNYTIYAVGTANSTNGVNYLQGTKCDPVEASKIAAITEIYYNDGEISWDAVENVKTYKVVVTVDSHDSIYFTNNLQFNLYQIDSLFTDGQKYDVSVVPYTTSVNNAIILGVVVPTEIEIYKSMSAQNLRVENGVFKWDITTAMIDTYLGAGQYNISEIDSMIRDVIDGVDITNTAELQTFFNLFNFKIDINGVVSDYEINSLYYLMASDSSKLTFGMSIDDVVDTHTTFTISIQNKGNQGVEGDSTIPFVLKSEFSQSLTAVKAPVVNKTVSQNGNISFSLLTQADLDGNEITSEFIKNYTIMATPSLPGMPTIYADLTIPSDFDLDTYSVNLRDDGLVFKNLTTNTPSDFLLNLSYTIDIKSMGTAFSDSNASVNYLKSNSYDAVDIFYFNHIANLDYREQFGGMIAWDNIPEAESQDVYILQKDIYANDYSNGNDKEWINDENVLKINIAQNFTGIDFVDDTYGTDQLINLDAGQYVIGIRAIGDESEYISQKYVNQAIPFTKLGQVTKNTEFAKNTWVYNGEFVWNDNGISTKYGVNVIETTPLGEIVATDIGNINANNYELIDDFNDIDNSYSLQIIAQGLYANSTNYVASQPITTDKFTRLANVDASVQNRHLEWTPVTNASSYDLKFNNGNIVNIDENSYAFENDKLVSGEFSLAVRAKATGYNYLHGIYCDNIKIRKFDDPILKVQNGVLSWDISPTYFPDEIELTIQECDELGQATGTKQTLILEGETERNYILGEEYDSAYYNVTIKYNPEQGLINGHYGVSSNIIEMQVFKLQTLEVEDGIYVDPNSGVQAESSFTNYIKWQADPNTENYVVMVGTLEEYKYSIYSNQSTKYFEDITVDGKDYIAFDMSSITLTKMILNVYSGGTINESYNVAGVKYIKSETFEKMITLPTQGPTIISTSVDHAKGIIKWAPFDDGSDSDDDVVVSGAAAGVEITLSYLQTAESTAAADAVQVTDQKVYVAYDQGTTYYVPAIGKNFEISMKYIQGSYASEIVEIADVTTNGLFLYGSGTQENPYVIDSNESNTESMNNELVNYVNNIRYRSNAVISFAKSVTLPQDQDWVTIDNFGGTLLGNGYTLDNIQLPKNNGYISMFDTVDQNAIIDGFTFVYDRDNGNINLGSSNANIAGITHNNYGTISNMKLNGEIKVTGTNVYMGGVANNNYGIISNITLNDDSNGYDKFVIEASAYQNSQIGGVVHSNYNIISDITILGEIVAAGETISSCKGAQIGGVSYKNTSMIKNVVNNSTMMAGNGVGGISYLSTRYNSHSATQEEFGRVDNAVYNAKALIVDKIYTLATLKQFIDGQKVTSFNASKYGDATEGSKFGGINAVHDYGSINHCYVVVEDETDLQMLLLTNGDKNFIGGLIGSLYGYSQSIIGSEDNYGVANNCYTNFTGREISYDVTDLNISSANIGAITNYSYAGKFVGRFTSTPDDDIFTNCSVYNVETSRFTLYGRNQAGPTTVIDFTNNLAAGLTALNSTNDYGTQNDYEYVLNTDDNTSTFMPYILQLKTTTETE